jgi:hypothetical protein
MNIFVLDNDPRIAARAHCDRHVVKMPSETAQMLSTALHLHGVADDRLWKPTHAGHPCTRWAAATRSNFEWLAELGFALVEEHARRYPHTEAGRRGHAAGPIIIAALDHLHQVPDGPLTEQPRAMPEALQTAPSVVDAYREFYRASKARFATWRAPARPPAWWPAGRIPEESQGRLE